METYLAKIQLLSGGQVEDITYKLVQSTTKEEAHEKIQEVYKRAITQGFRVIIEVQDTIK